MPIGITGEAPEPSPAEKRLLMASLGVAGGYAGSLGALFAIHKWLLDARGQPLVTDFVAVWSAGRLALKGAALSAYDGRLQHAGEVAAIGRDFAGYLGWPYPPSFFFIAAPLALLPYGWAFVAMVVASMALYGWTVAAVARRLGAVAVALAMPWALACALVGQNGFLTAALIGGVLLTLDKRPAVSGILLGLLTYKPQFGLLFPLALAAGGRWRTIGWAGVCVLALAAISSAVFGADVFAAFFKELPNTTQALVAHGGVGWAKLQSLYGLARSLGASNALGWGAQGVMIAACAAGVVWAWRSRVPAELKAASLPVGAVLATPYVFAYDLPVLGIAAAFLYRQRPYDRLEYAGLGFAALAVVVLLFASVPTGFFASVVFAALVIRRCAAAIAVQAAPQPALQPAG